MPEGGFTNLFLVALVAFGVPLLLGLVPQVRVPGPVLEIVAGIVLGPAVLGWVHADLPVQVLAVVGLAFLLFLAGLEIDLRALRGRSFVLALAGFAITLVIGVVAGGAFTAAGWVDSPLLLAVTLSATSLGLVVPVLKDADVGAVFALVDRDAMSHPRLRAKLDAVGYGFVVPIFFVASGVRLDLRGLFADPAALARVPAFLLALLAARGLAALPLLPSIGTRATVAAGLLQATSLPFILTATQIGIATAVLSPVTAAALVTAGLLSVLLFPAGALAVLRARPDAAPVPGHDADADAAPEGAATPART